MAGAQMTRPLDVTPKVAPDPDGLVSLPGEALLDALRENA